MFYFIADFGWFNLLSKLYLLSDNIYSNMTSNDLLLLGGDNFYPYGLEHDNDNKLKLFGEIFNKHQNNIYGVLGNHDYYGNINFQMKNNDYFKIPYNYYKINQNNIDVYMIDTTILNPFYYTRVNEVLNNLNKYKYEKIKDNDYIDFDTKKKLILKEVFDIRREMLEWLNAKMKISNMENNKIIVVGHYPIYSNGHYILNNDNNMCFKHLLPLFIKYGVSAYVSGHDHSNQHFEFDYKFLMDLYNSMKLDELDDIDFIKNNMENLKYNPKYKLNNFICGTAIEKYNSKYYNNNTDIAKYNNVDNNCYMTFKKSINNIIFSFINSETNKLEYKYIV